MARNFTCAIHITLHGVVQIRFPRGKKTDWTHTLRSLKHLEEMACKVADAVAVCIDSDEFSGSVTTGSL